MGWRRQTRLLVGLALLLAAGASALMTPGIRHQHPAGARGHSHSVSTRSPWTAPQHAHAHPHSHAHGHGHAHSHGHSHEDADRGRRSTPQTAPRIAGSASHIHVSILGFEFTLPDPWHAGALDESSMAAETETAAHAAGEITHQQSATPTVRGPSTAAQLWEFVLHFKSLVPARWSYRAIRPVATWSTCRPWIDAGRDRPEPDVPPPKATA